MIQEGMANLRHGTMFIKSATTIDCAIFDPSRGIIGQSWHLDVAISGILDDNGFVFDFSELKSMVRSTTKSSIDHALIIPVGSQHVRYIEGSQDTEIWQMQSKNHHEGKSLTWTYECPKGSVFPLRKVAIYPDTVAKEFARLLRHRLPESITEVEVTLSEESATPTEAFFCYTHGIAGHSGLCQRLLHGHRSRVEVHVAGDRRPDLEHYLAREVLGGHVHITTKDQIHSGSLGTGCRGEDGTSLNLGVTGSLGPFKAQLPSHRVLAVENETSIECIARQLAKIIADRPDIHGSVVVDCYEGIGKGARAEIRAT